MILIDRLFPLLTLLALLLTSAIPQGWMPAMGNDGKVLLVLCTGEGTVEQWVDLDPDDPVHDDTDSRIMCPFAGMTADINLPSVGEIVPFTAPIQARWTHRDFTHRSAGFYTRYDARGPPLIS
ncbi:DUF2946 domain-containing protein [Ruegeria sp. Ofav3-42]|uniref:DUF2946 domain-containing protein n=1 Tax=Ruegeria sp. Ofav3-42 TaxID=2917759 RepID=UPI001EF419FA|nr:DUF2946 domain-containing protein [Ruegeria sp. Ofav3-42]MCG7522257.1 DUF2946 domain-containing protein [Ruegeria sp. Ofav3-42]